jgi:hypothetical protein
MLVLKFLHIASMFTGVAIALGGGGVVALIARGDVRTIRSAFRVMTRLSPVIPTFFTLGVAFGLATAWTGGLDFLRPWLLIAYVLFIAATILGAAFESPWQKRVLAAAMASPEESPSAELQVLMRDPRERLAFWATLVIIAAFIFDMVVKPFGL